MAESHTLLNIITVCTELLIFNSHIVSHLWVHNTAEMMPHSWRWRLWSLVVYSCQGWVIRLETSLMREARTEVGSSPFFSDFFLLMSDGFCYFLLSKRRNSSAPSITYLVFGFASHPSRVFGRMPWLIAVPCTYLTLCLATFVTWMTATCNYTHLW